MAGPVRSYSLAFTYPCQLLHRERRIRQMEGEPYYRRLPECYRRRTQAVRILGGREGMVW